MTPSNELQFDGWTVDRVSGEVSREGHSSRLPQQPLRILIELFDHAGEVVTREQLVKVLWPAGIVDFDNGLNVAVRKLRVALEDVGDTPRYIETLPRVGYRFVGRKAPPAKSARGRAALALGLVALAAAVAFGWWVGRDEPPAQYVPSVRAHELYLEGLHHQSRRDRNAAPLAIERFEAALREDPKYAAAWAALGTVTSGAVIRHMILPAEGLPKARAAGLKAIELDPLLVEGHTLMGQIHLDWDKDFAAAKRELDLARALNPNSARYWHIQGMWLGQQGRVEEALDAVRRARGLEPMTPLYAGNYAVLLFMARRYDELIEFSKTLVDANPNFDQARSMLARGLIATGDFEGALTQLQMRVGAGVSQADLGVLFAKMGRREDALREIAQLEARGSEGYGVAFDLALIRVALGDLDLGCDLLMRAMTDHSVLVNWLRLDPRLDPLRGRQCYAAAEKKLFGT